MTDIDLKTVVGKYHLASQEHFEDYLKAIGVGLAKRALVMNEFSHIDCQIHGDEWTVEIKGIRDSTLKFKLGEETPERVTEDGRKVTELFTLEGNKMIQKERWDGNKEATYVHELTGDDWTMNIYYNNVKCVRHYKREH